MSCEAKTQPLMKSATAQKMWMLEITMKVIRRMSGDSIVHELRQWGNEVSTKRTEAVATILV